MQELRATRVLIVDDDDGFRMALAAMVRRFGFAVETVARGEEGLSRLRGADAPEIALVDLHMEPVGGLDILRGKGRTATRVVVLTAHGSIQTAVEAMKLGAFSFLEKPVDPGLLEELLRQAREDGEGRGSGADSPALIGRSAAMEDVRRFIARVAPTDETVALYGETGTGKDVVARLLHAASGRAKGPFVAFNAASVPRDLFESELFGHRKGAFTGAHSARLGLFREAEGGTLFIDEVAELPLESQAKFLRAIESRAIRPVGESRELAVDVRLVAATHRPLWKEVQQGRFREDLFFRLQVLPLYLPPLRARREDILPLAEHFLQRVSNRALTFSDDARSVLTRYDWPGNARELLNVVRRLALFSEGQLVPGTLVRAMIDASAFGPVEPLDTPDKLQENEDPIPTLEALERQHIERALALTQGNITRAAQQLGIDRRTLQRKMLALGLRVEEDS